MGKLLIIKTGCSDKKVIQRCGDCEIRIVRYAGLSHDDVIVAPVYKNIIPAIDDISSIIITGSHSMITDEEPWSIETSRWLKDILRKGIPTLGICFGHQLIAHTLGGAVDYHQLGEEKGHVRIELTGEGKKDPLLRVLPQRFSAYSSHKQTVTKLPSSARILAKNSFESKHAVYFGNKIWGVQFHPEYTGDYEYLDNNHGALLLRQFMKIAG